MTSNTGALRYFGCIKSGTTPASGEAEYWGGEVRWATPEDLGKLVGDKISATRRHVTEKAVAERNLAILPVGSVLISTRAPIGHMAINEQPMAFNQGCRGIIPSGLVHGPFLYYLLKSRTPELNAMANGTTFVELTSSELAAVQVSFPPLETQHHIAQFLDDKTTQIDALIEKKRALLDRLAEKRQAQITHAITKGLNPDTPMKASGIDWLGEIPAHWEAIPLKRMIESSTYGISASLEPDGEVAILRMGNLVEGELDLSNLKFLDELDESLLLRADDVIFNRTNSLDLVGKTAIYRGGFEGKLSLASYLVRFRFFARYRPAFANYVMGASVLMDFARTLALPSIGQANLNPNRYAAIIFPIPPSDEQDAIVQYLDEDGGMVRTAIAKIQQSISHLQEYRSALITAAVTGQLDLEAA